MTGVDLVRCNSLLDRSGAMLVLGESHRLGPRCPENVPEAVIASKIGTSATAELQAETSGSWICPVRYHTRRRCSSPSTRTDTRADKRDSVVLSYNRKLWMRE